MKNKIIWLLTIFVFLSCAFLAKNLRASGTVTWKGLVIFRSNPVVNSILQHDADFEIGLRDDGVVVWRNIQN